MKLVKYHLVFVKQFSELYLTSCTIYVSNTNVAVTLAQFLWFLQNEGKWIKRGQNHYRHEHVESRSSANRECVASVRDRFWAVSSFQICIFKGLYFSSCVINLDFLGLKNYLLKSPNIIFEIGRTI